MIFHWKEWYHYQDWSAVSLPGLSSIRSVYMEGGCS